MHCYSTLEPSEVHLAATSTSKIYCSLTRAYMILPHEPNQNVQDLTCFCLIWWLRKLVNQLAAFLKSRRLVNCTGEFIQLLSRHQSSMNIQVYAPIGKLVLMHAWRTVARLLALHLFPLLLFGIICNAKTLFLDDGIDTNACTEPILTMQRLLRANSSLC